MHPVPLGEVGEKSSSAAKNSLTSGAATRSMRRTIH
jgi:hypothetical protein